MQLENKQYSVVNNIFSDKVLKLLEPYSILLPTDKSSYDVWPLESTNNRTAPECFTCDVLGKDRTEIINELFENPNLPCYKKTWLKHCDIAVQKMPVGGFIDRHRDYCLFSLTVFLSSFEGGQFVWSDEQGNDHVVDPAPNKAVIACYNDYIYGAPHEVMPVISGLRFTLQLFVFSKQKTNQRTNVVWETKEP